MKSLVKRGTLKSPGRISALATDKSENPQRRSYKVSGGRTPGNARRTPPDSTVPHLHRTTTGGNTVNSGTLDSILVESPYSYGAGGRRRSSHIPPTPQAPQTTPQTPQKSFRQFLSSIFQRIWGKIPIREVK